MSLSKNFKITTIAEEHRKAVIDIFNYFIKNGYAAYPQEQLPYEFFDMMLKMTHGYPAVVVKDSTRQGQVVGFAFMRPYHSMKTFKRAAEVSYFLLPDVTRQGIGKAIIELFTQEAKKIEVDTLLADISSLNTQSIQFHEKMGFTPCGCFRRVGKKFNKDFDVVWMQKLL